MKKTSVFDIIGPIMIGPSSSHTAGAARLGKIAKIIATGTNFKIKKVEFLLHGSFGKTYRGHGTDRALVAGILGMDPWDSNLKDSLSIAEKEGIEIVFKEEDLVDVHPNTVKFLIWRNDDTLVKVQGSSIGGGSIQINEVDGEEVKFTGDYPTLIIKHKDIPGMVSKVTTLLYEENINIAFMEVFRGKKGTIATMIFETDSMIPETIREKLITLGNIERVRIITPIKEGE